jgi:hypothetical protein
MINGLVDAGGERVRKPKKKNSNENKRTREGYLTS